jgi:hypothetical protein
MNCTHLRDSTPNIHVFIFYCSGLLACNAYMKNDYIYYMGFLNEWQADLTWYSAWPDATLYKSDGAEFQCVVRVCGCDTGEQIVTSWCWITTNFLHTQIVYNVYHHGRSRSVSCGRGPIKE